LEDGTLNKNTELNNFQFKERICRLGDVILISQSGVVSDSQSPPGTEEKELAPKTTEQITAFADQDAGWTTEKVGYYEPTNGPR